MLCCYCCKFCERRKITSGIKFYLCKKKNAWVEYPCNEGEYIDKRRL